MPIYKNYILICLILMNIFLNIGVFYMTRTKGLGLKFIPQDYAAILMGITMAFVFFGFIYTNFLEYIEIEYKKEQ